MFNETVKDTDEIPFWEIINIHDYLCHLIMRIILLGIIEVLLICLVSKIFDKVAIDDEELYVIRIVGIYGCIQYSSLQVYRNEQVVTHQSYSPVFGHRFHRIFIVLDNVVVQVFHRSLVEVIQLDYILIPELLAQTLFPEVSPDGLVDVLFKKNPEMFKTTRFLVHFRTQIDDVVYDLDEETVGKRTRVSILGSQTHVPPVLFDFLE